jgi:threonine dehydrogenase-like Zn-dependent dehydrogenase
MKALSMAGYRDIGWIDIPKPEAGPLDAIVRPIALAPCTSDVLLAFKGGRGDDTPKVVLGHEALGEVVEVGSAVARIRLGDRVIVPALTPDWGAIEVQDHRFQHTNGMGRSEQFSSLKPGVFAEYFHVNHADMNLAILPDDISPLDAIMCCDMMSTGLKGAEMAEIGFGDTVVVIGIGPVGLMAVAGAALAGAGRLAAVGHRKKCTELAVVFGATDIIDYRTQDVEKMVFDMTRGAGADSVIIAGGGTPSLDLAIRIVKPGGTVSNIEYFGEGDTIPIPRFAWGKGMSEKNIKSGLCPGGRLRMEKMVDLIRFGRIKPGLMATQVFHRFEEIETAMRMMAEKTEDVVKPVVLLE